MSARSAGELREALRRAAEDIPGEEVDEQELENIEWWGSDLRELAGRDKHWLVKLIDFLRTSKEFEILSDIPEDEPELQAVE